MIYLDHNSTTPLNSRVVDAMAEALASLYGNPSSAHSAGAAAAAAIEQARERVAELVGADRTDVTFCSSATEAINTVIRAARGLVITTAVEHAATLRAVALHERLGFEAVRLAVDADGVVPLDSLTEQLDTRPVALVSVIWVNNETGVISPIDAIARLCEARRVPLHVDAVQAAGKLPIFLDNLPIDFLTISAHKIGGPKGIAALVNRQGRPLPPLIVGGGQEHGRRSGTENVPGIVGFGVAAGLALQELEATNASTSMLRDHFEERIQTLYPFARINGAGAPRVSNTSSVSFPGVGGDDLACYLDGQGICVSTGSACHSATTEPSHVIQAMTGSREHAASTVRFSLGSTSTLDEIDRCLEVVTSGIAALASVSPAVPVRMTEPADPEPLKHAWTLSS